MAVIVLRQKLMHEQEMPKEQGDRKQQRQQQSWVMPYSGMKQCMYNNSYLLQTVSLKARGSTCYVSTFQSSATNTTLQL